MLRAAAAAAVAAVLAAALLPAPPAVAAPGLPTIVQDDAIFLHSPPDEAGEGLEHLRSLGVDWVRVTAGWSEIAPLARSARRPEFDASDPDAYPAGSWRNLDRAVSLARGAGLEVMIDIAFWAPRWAVSRGIRPRSRQRWGVDAAAYAEFAEAVARRYSGRYRSGRPLPPAARLIVGDQRPILPAAGAFTIWNEPNYRTFLMPQWSRRGGHWWARSPHLYRELVRAAHPRIKAVAPGSLVLIGGTASVGAQRPGSSRSSVPPLRFLRELACLDGQLRPMRRRECRGYEPLPGDGWAHHPYSLDLPPWQPDPKPDNVRMADLDRMTDLLGRLHRAGRTRSRMGVWITEYGYETNPPDPTRPFGLNDQSRFLPEAELQAWLNPHVLSFAQFLLRDRPPRRARDRRARWRDYQSGLRTADGTPKPAEDAFRYSLVVRRGGPDSIRVWGHVRPGRGQRTVRITTPVAGTWAPVPDLPAVIRTDEHGGFLASASADPEALYRMEVLEDGEWTPGVALKPVR